MAHTHPTWQALWLLNGSKWRYDWALIRLCRSGECCASFVLATIRNSQVLQRKQA